MRDEYNIMSLEPRKNPYFKTKEHLMKNSNINVKKAPTETQMEMLKQAANRPICFDDDVYGIHKCFETRIGNCVCFFSKLFCGAGPV